MFLIVLFGDTDFNPRSHEESDEWLENKAIKYTNFNPRSHEESDQQIRHLRRRPHQISIHALTKRATFAQKFENLPQLFQSTLSRRERRTFTGFCVG